MNSFFLSTILFLHNLMDRANVFFFFIIIIIIIAGGASDIFFTHKMFID